MAAAALGQIGAGDIALKQSLENRVPDLTMEAQSFGALAELGARSLFGVVADGLVLLRGLASAEVLEVVDDGKGQAAFKRGDAAYGLIS